MRGGEVFSLLFLLHTPSMRLGGGNVALHRTLPFLVLSSSKLTLLSTPLKDPTLREGGA